MTKENLLIWKDHYEKKLQAGDDSAKIQLAKIEKNLAGYAHHDAQAAPTPEGKGGKKVKGGE